MTVLKIFKLEDSEEAEVVSTLTEGEHVIGRGFLNCNDKRVSRRHAVILIDQNSVTIKSVHINPCFHKSSEGNSISILPKDRSISLNDNDQFALLSDNFWFKVRVVKDETNNKKQFEDSEHILKDINISNDIIVTNKRSSNESSEASSHKKQRTNSAGTSQIDDMQEISRNIPEVILGDRLLRNLEIIVSEDYGNSVVNESLNQTVSDVGNTVSNVESGLLSSEKAEDGLKEMEINQNNVSENLPDVINKKSIKEEPKISVISQDSKIEDDPSTSVIPKIETTEEDNNSNRDGDEIPLNQKQDENQDESNQNMSDNTSNPQPMKTRRDRCWYGPACYRKNPLHHINFSHPGDIDYDSDPTDDRPDCPFGNTCYRNNLQHRREFKHKGKPAKQPNIQSPSSPSTSALPAKPPKKRNRKKQQKKKEESDETNSGDDVPSDENDDQDTTPRKKRKAAQKKVKLNETPEDDYDYQDPFIDDDSSDEFELSSGDEDNEDTDWEDSQQVDEQSQETRRLLKEAKKFTKTKKKP